MKVLGSIISKNNNKSAMLYKIYYQIIWYKKNIIIEILPSGLL